MGPMGPTGFMAEPDFRGSLRDPHRLRGRHHVTALVDQLTQSGASRRQAALSRAVCRTAEYVSGALWASHEIVGFEPTIHDIKNRCLTAWPYLSCGGCRDLMQAKNRPVNFRRRHDLAAGPPWEAPRRIRGASKGGAAEKLRGAEGFAGKSKFFNSKMNEFQKWIL
jgi:hypothetical protein